MCINTAGQGGSPGQPSSLGCRPAERLLGLHGAGLLEFDLLIIDELGYLPMNRQGIHNLFQFIKGLYEYRSVILSQQGLHQLGDLFRDENIAVPIVDRLIHHSHVFMLGGESYRLRQKIGN